MLIIRVTVIVLFLANGIACCGQDFFQKANTLIDIIVQKHVQPIAVDSSFSNSVFIEYLHTIDPSRRIFSKEDIASLYSFRFTLVEAIQKKDTSFLHATKSIYKKNIQHYNLWVSDYLSRSLNFNEQLFFGPAVSSIQAHFSQSQLEVYQKAFLKYEILKILFKRDSVMFAAQVFQSREADARKIVLKAEKATISKWLYPEGGLDKYFKEAWLKSIAKAFDPHTAYFTFSEEKEFTSSISESALSFGFDVDENNLGEIVIQRIVPAGPAWNSNLMHQGDVLLAIQTSEGKTIDFDGLSTNDVEEIIHSYSITQGKLVIRKADGQNTIVSLTKTKIEQTQNIVKSFVLHGSKKIGYISLPGFYTQWENDDSPGCASDVAKELVKLKKENIDGLIFDLRFNGGGSLDEALDLAGIFIDVGPLAMFKEGKQPIITLKDNNKGTVYDGPLVIMINGLSASASELFTATLQDYNRGIVVGSPTFGKGTGQSIIPFPKNPATLSTTNRTSKESIKITSDRIYRITGKSYQHRGIQPDIIMPDFTLFISEKEKFYRNSLPPDSISKKAYYTAFPTLPSNILWQKSSIRVNQSIQFSQVQQLIRETLSPIPLRLPDYIHHHMRIQNLTKIINSIRSQGKLFHASFTSFDSSLLQIDEDYKSMNTKLATELEDSIYIREAFTILNDYLAMSKK